MGPEVSLVPLVSQGKGGEGDELTVPPLVSRASGRVASSSLGDRAHFIPNVVAAAVALAVAVAIMMMPPLEGADIFIVV